ncbi:MAG: hypothetical protein ACFFCZ_07785 [Promethearchaeota archaeon]
MKSKRSKFKRLQKDHRSQMFVVASLIIAFYLLSITVLLLEIRLVENVEGDITIVEEVYQGIQRESLEHTKLLLWQWQRGQNTTNLQNSFQAFIPFLVEYALNYNIQAVIIPDFSLGGFTNVTNYAADFTIDMSLYTEKTTLTSQFDISVSI